MEDELEIIGAASVGAVARDINGDGYLQGPCPNCGTELLGDFCVTCGQSAKDMKRPFLALFLDIIGDVFSFDGRLARTVPALMLRPGHVTRSYLDGKRMRYVPPFRLFLIASVLFFLVLFSLGERQEWLQGDNFVNPAREAIGAVVVDGQPIGKLDGFDEIFNEDGTLNRAEAIDFLDELEDGGVFETEAETEEFLTRLESISDLDVSRTEMFSAIQKWAPRLSFLLLPFYVISLTLMHFWMRRVYIYDHVIVALHLQTFLYFAATLAIWFSSVSPGWAWGIFGVAIPIYVFRLLRKSYDTIWFMDVLRTFFMIIFSFVAFVLLVVAISLVGANEAGLFTWEQVISEAEFDF